MVSERERDDLRAPMPDLLRERCGITDLRRSFRCPSPDHDDSDPSAHYYENGNPVHCFGCGKTWDVFTLVGELDGIDAFPDQAKAVAANPTTPSLTGSIPPRHPYINMNEGIVGGAWKAGGRGRPPALQSMPCAGARGSSKMSGWSRW